MKRAQSKPLSISAAQLKAYRADTYRLKPRLRLHNEQDAVRFANERGFVYFWPIKGVEMPSLWAAVAGNRPVADEHDDPGHVTWGWKDKLLSARQWHYGKLLRGKATIVSLKTLPCFYALSENYGDLHHDYLSQYEEGRLTQEAKAIFEALLEKGPLDTLALRREARLANKESSTRFERALTELQVGLKILPIGIAEAGAWRYAFIYDLVDRRFPELAERSRLIERGEARARLVDLYLKSVGAANEGQIAHLFRWRPEDVRQACASLLDTGRAKPLERFAGTPGKWLVSVALVRFPPSRRR